MKRPSLPCPRFETPATTGAGVRKKTVTTIEMRQITIVKRPVVADGAWCSSCLENVELVTPRQAALLAGIGLLDLCRQVVADEIHVLETTNGAFICLNSLLKSSQNNSSPNSD
jgi:hypothetical protein